MKELLILLRHSLRRMAGLTLAAGLVLVLFQVLVVNQACDLQASNSFEQLGKLIPEFMRKIIGPGMTSLLSFKGTVCVGYFHFVVQAALVAMAVAYGTMITGEIESGFMDLILSRSLARHWLITRSILVAIAGIGTLLGLMVLATWLALTFMAPDGAVWPSAGLVGTLALNLGLVLLCWNGIALAIGAGARRRGAAGAAVGVLVFLAFLLDYLATSWEPAQNVAWLLPIHIYNPFEILMGHPIPLRHILVLGGIAVVSYAIAYIVFARRDVSH